MSNQSDQKKLQKIIKQFITPNDISLKKRTF